MQRTPPRHLAPPVRVHSRARDHLLVESILAMVAIVITTAIVIGALLDRQESSAARLPNLLPPAPTTTRVAPAASEPATAAGPAAKGGPLANPGFEAGLEGWRSLGGAGLERVGGAHQGDWAAQLSRGSARWPGLSLADILKVQTVHVYQGTVWVRASQPGTTVQVNLFEVAGGKRFAVDTVGAVVGTGWERLEVAHEGHRAGAMLAVEILAPDLPGGARLLVDDLGITRKAGTSITAPHTSH
jgi:Carbohydrate binding domain